jgi:hypothetical protein
VQCTDTYVHAAFSAYGKKRKEEEEMEEEESKVI